MTTFNVYVRENVSDPKTTLVRGLNSPLYSVSGLTKGKKYLFSVGDERGTVEKLSDEKVILFGQYWAPVNLAYKPAHWIDETTAIASSGSKLVSISNNINEKDIVFNQSTDLYQPNISTHESGVRSFLFNGTNQFLNSASSVILSEYRKTNKAWAFVVMRKLNVDATAINRNIISNAPGNAGGGGRFSLGIGGNDPNQLYLYSEIMDGGAGALINLNHTFNNTDTVIVFAQVDFTTNMATISVDGAIIYNASFGTVSETSDTQAYWNAGIGAFVGSPPVVHCDMELLCLMQGGISSGLQTESERQKLEGWAAHKYGLTDNLPIDHPYKTLIPTV